MSCNFAKDRYFRGGGGSLLFVGRGGVGALLFVTHDLQVVKSIGHFTVVCLVTWPWIGSEAQGMTLFWYRPHCFSYVDHAVLMLTSLHLHMKNSVVCIKTRSPPASLPIQGQVTKHTIVKWPINVTFGKVVIFSGGTLLSEF